MARAAREADGIYVPGGTAYLGNLLLTALPETVAVRGRLYGIDADYRVMLRLEAHLLSRRCCAGGGENEWEEAEAGEVLEQLLGLFYAEVPNDKLEACFAMLAFYRRFGKGQAAGAEGKAEAEARMGADTPTEGKAEARMNAGVSPAPSAPPVYSCVEDDGLIYAAFLTQYGIDLCAVPFLHWFQYCALLEGLEDGRRFTQAIGYRRMEIRNDMTKEEKAFYRRMKRLYALPDGLTGAEKENRFAQALSRL